MPAWGASSVRALSARGESMAVSDEIEAVLQAKADGLIRKSAKDLSEIIDPAFVYVNSRGIKLEKDAYISKICQATDWGFGGQEREGLEVRDFGAFAVATMTLHDRFVHSGRTTKATYQSLCVFRNVDGRWLWVAGQTMTPETCPRG